MDFSSVIFTNKCHATVDGPDEWIKCWISSNHSPPPPVRVRHYQGRGGVIFWSAIIDVVVRQFRIENGVKIDSGDYYAFVNEHFTPW